MEQERCLLCDAGDFDEQIETARGYLAQRMVTALDPKRVIRHLRITRATWRNWANGRYAPDVRNFRALIDLTRGRYTDGLCEEHKLAASRCSRARLSERDAISIVARFQAGESADAIAARYKVTPRHVRQIVRGTRYQTRTVFGD